MKLSLVIPCYNEEEVLPETIRRLTLLMQDMVDRSLIAVDSEVILVDDGSRDGTWELIEQSSRTNSLIRGLKLSRNRGHQAALVAGLFAADGDAVISIDADLQDDLAAIEAMVNQYIKGVEIVYGVRKRRDTDTFFKRASAEGYYRLLAALGVEIVFNHADYRLLSRRAIDALKQFKERNLFLRGIIPQLGFPSAVVYYDRGERFAGESKYPLRKMLAFAWQGVTSFSAAPLRAIIGLGVIISMASFGVAAWALAIRMFSDQAVPGWASTVIPMYFLGGIQLLCIGIIGEYMSKIYVEVKGRPHYFIESDVGQQSVVDAKNPAIFKEVNPIINSSGA